MTLQTSGATVSTGHPKGGKEERREDESERVNEREEKEKIGRKDVKKGRRKGWKHTYVVAGRNREPTKNGKRQLHKPLQLDSHVRSVGLHREEEGRGEGREGRRDGESNNDGGDLGCPGWSYPGQPQEDHSRGRTGFLLHFNFLNRLLDLWRGGIPYIIIIIAHQF